MIARSNQLLELLVKAGSSNQMLQGVAASNHGVD